MEEKYGTYMKLGVGPIFPTISSIPDQPPPPPPDLQHYAMVIMGGGGGGGGEICSFGSDMGGIGGSAATNSSGLSGGDSGGGCGGGSLDDMELIGGDGGYSSSCGTRWPKEETLALLHIRSSLDSKFKQANHKGPLWDEISRIMFVEHGYKRSGKKCSEKFENLYKYYKKIKEGKAGRRRRDKTPNNYRFFPQLEAIYGRETNTNPNKMINSATIPPICLEDINDQNCLEQTINKRMLKKKKSWKSSMITDLIETKMNTLMEKQDKWMEKVVHTIEQKGKERISKEEQWRKQKASRTEKQTMFRSNEQAYIESRDLSLIQALHKLTSNKSALIEETSATCNDYVTSGWGENEVAQLIQLRSSMETRFEQASAGGYNMMMEDVLWEEIALTMGCLGYNKRNAMVYKAKWDHIKFLLDNKKKKDNNMMTRCSNLYADIDHQLHNNYNMFHQEAGQRGHVALNHDQQKINDEGYYRVLMSDPHAIINGNYYGN